jgi:hypothetical protein
MVIKDEVKFLHMREKKPNRDPHCAAKEWGKLLHVAEYDINPKPNHKLDKKKSIMLWIKKLNKLSEVKFKKQSLCI